MTAALRDRMRRGERVTGTFVKTSAPHVVEVLGLAGLDFIVADQEHAPIDLGALDILALAARGVGLPLLVRTPNAAAASISPALDLGALGVMVPHVQTAATAIGVAEAVKFARGQRGFSPSARAGGYSTRDAATYRAEADAGSVILAQIEDAGALDNLDEIAAVPEVDVLFVGPADLALSLGCPIDAPEIAHVVDATVAAARRAGKAAGLFVGTGSQIGRWAAKGVTVFVVGSDQSLLLGAARELVRAAGEMDTRVS